MDFPDHVDYYVYRYPHPQEVAMKTVQMTLDEDLVKAVDSAAKRLRTTRSAFTRNALRDALRKLTVCAMERRHRAGYEKRPARKGEFDLWEPEQDWGDA